MCSPLILFIGTISIYTPYQTHMISPFYPCFHQPFCLLQAFSRHPQKDLDWSFMTKKFSILVKDQFAERPFHLSLPKPLKTPINSLCPHPPECIKWFPHTFFPFLVKMSSKQGIFPKVVLAGYQI